jgi:hypothetical protein
MVMSRPNTKKISKKSADTCKLENHFRGVDAAIVHFLDYWASKDPERFVYPGFRAIVNAAKNWAKKDKGNPEKLVPSYSKTWVEKRIRHLEKKRVLSPRVRRLRDFEERKGWIVAPHDSLCVRKVCRGKSACVLLGPGAGGHWEATMPGNPDSIRWVGFGAHTTAHSTDNSTDESTDNSTDNTTAHSTDNSTDVRDDAKELTSTLPELCFRSFESSRSLEPIPSCQSTESGRPDGSRSLAASSQPKPKSKPIQQQWSEFKNGHTCDEEKLPDVFRYAEPAPGEHQKILAQAATLSREYFVMALEQFIEMQSPPLSTLDYGRWTRWLRDGGDILTEWQENS